MKKPTWVTVVGVLGIIFSCLGILGAGQEMMMPRMVKMQMEMFSDFEKMIEAEMERERADHPYSEGDYQGNAEFPMGMFNSFMKMMDYPNWFGTWSIIAGILKLMVCAFFLLASIETVFHQFILLGRRRKHPFRRDQRRRRFVRRVLYCNDHGYRRPFWNPDRYRFNHCRCNG